MAWECPCGVSNKDSKQKCRACRTPQGMVWTSQGFASPKEAYYLEKLTQHKAPHADHLGRLVRMVWIAGIVMGALAGIYLARIRSSQGLWATKAVLNAWKNLPWTFLNAWPSTEVLIGAGIIVPLLFFLLPGQVRQNTFTLFGHLVFAVIVASLVGTVTYFVGVFAYDLGPYFRFRW
ncbi:MAG: hypothetical protein ACE5K9_01435 [Candidatus Methylomirabilales bacterium]